MAFLQMFVVTVEVVTVFIQNTVFVGVAIVLATLVVVVVVQENATRGQVVLVHVLGCRRRLQLLKR